MISGGLLDTQPRIESGQQAVGVKFRQGKIPDEVPES
jgi:hypothetical protein